MPRLPSVSDLGAAPNVSGDRAIARADATPLFEGAAALGKGISQLGDAAGEFDVAKSRYEYAQAHADFLTNKIELDQKYANDTDYATRADRYQKDLTALHENSSGLIGSPAMRDRFTGDSRPQVAEALSKQQAIATAQEGDAQKAYLGAQGDKFIDQATNTSDPETRRQIGVSYGALVDGLAERGTITQLQAYQAKNDWARRFFVTDLYKRGETDPHGAINELLAAPGSGDEITNRIRVAEGVGKDPRSSAYSGFIDSTWLDVLKRNRPDLAQGRSDADLLALRADRGLVGQMTDAYRQENVGYLQKNGAPATPGAQYLAHFLGPAGAVATLKADPNAPIADVLTQAVGAKKAQAMVDANPSILQGQLAGSVTKWADGKMGGVTPGSGSPYDFLAPDVREMLLAHARSQLEKQQTVDRIGFQSQVANALQEASDTGNVSKPLTLPDFVQRYGADGGPQKFREYSIAVAAGRTENALQTMPREQAAAAVEALAPKPADPDYAAKAEVYAHAQQALGKINQQLYGDSTHKPDPAGYAAVKLPASKEAYAGFLAAANGPDDARANGAQHYAAVTLTEQARMGVSADGQRVVPKAYADAISGKLGSIATSNDPTARPGLVGQVQREAAMWGPYWPQVVGQLAPQVQPVVRAIAGGANANAMTRLLELDPKDTPAKTLKEQSETKSGDLTRALNEEISPLRRALLPGQRERDLPGIYGVTEKLAALYVMDGDSAPEAARKAFGHVLGDNYNFRDTFMIPKQAPVSPDAVQRGTLAARALLGGDYHPGADESVAHAFNVQPPIDNLPGRSNPGPVDLALVARDGRFVSEENGRGLNLYYNSKPVKTADGSPLLLSWPQLAQLGQGFTPGKRESLARRGISTATGFRD